MRAATLLAAFVGWGLVAAFASQASPGLGFLLGLAVGAGAMLAGKSKT